MRIWVNAPRGPFNSIGANSFTIKINCYWYLLKLGTKTENEPQAIP